jgi:hypothetical protein
VRDSNTDIFRFTLNVTRAENILLERIADDSAAITKLDGSLNEDVE